MPVHFRLKKNRSAKKPAVTAASYAPTVATGSNHRTREHESQILLPNGRVIIQDPSLPRIPGQIGVRADRPVTEVDITQGRRLGVPINESNAFAEYHAPPSSPLSKHRLKREKQWLTWKDIVLPSLVSPFMELLRMTSSLRMEAALDVTSRRCFCCAHQRTLEIVVVRFFKLETITLSVSDCCSAGIQLVRSGLFPCSPVYPTLAVDIRVLDFVRRLFLRIAPNYTAWCGAVSDFLGAQGYRLPGEDSLRKRFTNCLQWFMSLHDLTSVRVSEEVQHARSLLFVESTVAPPSRTPRQHCGDPPSEASTMSDEEDEEDEPADKGESSSGTGRKREWRMVEKEEEEEEGEDTPCSLERPSEFLREACPACFGGQRTESAIVVLDACFTQKHNKHASKGGRDPPRRHPSSVFLSEDYVDQWSKYLEAKRSSKSKKQSNKRARTADAVENVDGAEEADHREYGLQVPKSVLDGCLSSFTAADETRMKGSTTFFDVTGQMTLLCRHDRPLWSVNMHTAGEAQHYTLALLSKLFEHLPNNVNVQLLYDIACQLHRSCLKWGLLKPYLTRLTFSISIFHAFGHQWPCQIVYHPRKCVGYGLTDGEGAERLWHGISRLIAYGRVAGYYMRIYNLDCQFKFNNEESLFKLASWLRRKLQACNVKRREAIAAVAACGFSEDRIRREWASQIAAQTKPLPRQNKRKVKSMIEEILRSRKMCETLQEKINSLRDRIIDGSVSAWDAATIELDVQTAEARLSKLQSQLRRKERSLGIGGTERLRQLVNNRFLILKMNAKALLIRIRERTRSRKFELDRLQRSARKHRSEERLHNHIQTAAKRREPGLVTLARKYNSARDEMEKLIQQGKAPRNSVAPPKLDPSKLFDLDVDDDIWLDIGFDDDDPDEPSTTPLLWLSSDEMRTGIRALLDKDRCDEELERLQLEQAAIQEWFSEEWEVVHAVIETAGDDDLVYQLKRRRHKLCHLYAYWDRSLSDFPVPEGLPTWGLLMEEAKQAVEEHILGGGIEKAEVVVFDVEHEEDADGLLTEYLDNLLVAENYKELRTIEEE